MNHLTEACLAWMMGTMVGKMSITNNKRSLCYHYRVSDEGWCDVLEVDDAPVIIGG